MSWSSRAGWSRFGLMVELRGRNFGAALAGGVPGAAIEHATTAAIDSACVVCTE